MNKKLAFIFPGQGSQAVGMLSDLAGRFPIVLETFAEASTALKYDLWQLVQQDPERLGQTEYTQPALLAGSIAVWRIWQNQGGAQPIVLAGHSLGEYTALVCAGAIDFASAIRLVAERGRLMQQAVPDGQGAMAAIIGLDIDKVQEVCRLSAQTDILSPANLNSPEQTVIAGHAKAVERALVLAKQAGAKLAKRLTVSVPSHCDLMKPAAKRLAASLTEFTMITPQIAVINNVDVTMNTEPDAIKDALVRQLYNPVRWVEIVQKLESMEVDMLIECGPGKVLTGLNKRITQNLLTVAIGDLESFEMTIKDQHVATK